MKPASLTGSLLVFFLVTVQGIDPPADVAPDNNCETIFVYGIIGTNCHGHSLQDVPTDIWENTEILDLSSNNLSYLAKQFWVSGCETRYNGSCSRFPNLVQLDLSSNLLVNISSASFFGMKQLQQLYVGNNLLTTIPDDLFLDNSKLETIDLSRNRLASLPPSVFQNMALSNLNLAGNMLCNLHHDTFQGLHSLKELQLQNNCIMVLHSHIFRDLENLLLLRIEGNHLRSFPVDLLSNLTNLLQLLASRNQLTYISPTTFVNNHQLRDVDLSQNYIRKLSRYVFQELVKFSVVSLAFNRLSSVYLSRLPVSLYHENNVTFLVQKNGLCTGIVNGIPCFLYDDKTGGFAHDSKSHIMDYSYNNISKIEFSKTEETHTLEYVHASFAGNRHLYIPTLFVKQERDIISLNVDETNLSWRNLTLFNELFELSHLRNISLVGCEACEHYTLQVLSQIFNSYLRVFVVCHNNNSNNNNNNYNTHNFTSGSTVSNAEDGKDKEVNATINFDTYNDHPCEYTDTVFIWNQKVQLSELNFICSNMLDCSYLSLPHLPEMMSFVNCLLLSHNNINVIEPHYFDNSLELIALDLSFNNLHHLPENVFDSLKNVVILKISNNHLTSLESNVFKYLSKVEILFLHGNPISSYPPDVFAMLELLNTLTVDFSNLTQFHDETFEKQVRLERLSMRHEHDISRPHITLGHEHFKSLNYLHSVEITGFKFNSSFNGTFLNSKIIRNIFFENCIIHSISIELISHSNLFQLHLPANEIHYLAKHVFRSSRNLRILVLSQNEIKFLISGLFAETVLLLYLDLSYNKLNCIPLKLFEPLTVLEELNLSHNPLIIFDYKIFAHLFSLQKLNLENSSSISYFGNVYLCEETEANYLSDATFVQQRNITNMGPRHSNTSRDNIIHITGNAFGSSTQLNRLNLAHNHIDVIDNGAFTNNINLLYLQLNFNNLTSITKLMFHNLVSLQLLYLQGNRLQFVEDRAFQDLRSLTYLQLGFNRLTSFDSRVLPGGSILEHLFLNDNLISLDKPTLFLNLESLTILNLHGNPLGVGLLDVLGHVPSLIVLNLGNTSVAEFGTDLLNNLPSLASLNLDGSPIGGLSTAHFSNSHELLVLNLTRPVTAGSSEDTGVTWRNMTLINYWFEMPELHFIILVGNPICEETQWTQIIQNLFLSDTWKVVVCSQETKIPGYYITSAGTTFIFAGA